MTRFVRQALVIARRDFTAIVLTPTFLIFLFGPLFMIGVATIGSLGAMRVVEGGGTRVVVFASAEEAKRIRAADSRLRMVIGSDPGPPAISVELWGEKPAANARALLGRSDVSAVLYGPPGRQVILHKPPGARDAEYLAQVAAAASARAPELRAVPTALPREGARNHSATAFGAVFVMFFLSLLLASQSISMLAEERNNKVIEILAAAVPLEAVFLGKLIGMLGVALLFTLFWAGLILTAASAGLGSLTLAAIAPAMGLPGFAALFLGYFMLSFLLLGAVFLGVGAQAATMREIQMLSLPVTIFQVSMFALASAAAGNPDSAIGLFAALFPFSSPFAMVARAASGAPAWQHFAALIWQLGWLALTVTIAARLFRRGVLKSGGARRG
jgi:ABC-2 type transport system permease protein